jgi:hypothetical protein
MLLETIALLVIRGLEPCRQDKWRRSFGALLVPVPYGEAFPQSVPACWQRTDPPLKAQLADEFISGDHENP